MLGHWFRWTVDDDVRLYVYANVILGDVRIAIMVIHDYCDRKKQYNPVPLTEENRKMLWACLSTAFQLPLTQLQRYPGKRPSFDVWINGNPIRLDHVSDIMSFKKFRQVIASHTGHVIRDDILRDIFHRIPHMNAKNWDKFAQIMLDLADTIKPMESPHVLPETTSPVMLEMTHDRPKMIPPAPYGVVWEHMNFRSQTEQRIGEALDRANVLFIPNAMVRAGTGERMTKELDFLICDRGHWGILEVDGSPWHPPERAALEHRRDRVFKAHGIRVVERYDAKECFETPDQVVQEFLTLLKGVMDERVPSGQG